MECLFTEYIKFVENFLFNYYRVLLENKYDKRLIKPFVDKYLNVRYRNDYVVRETNFVKRLNKELNNVAKAVIEENKDKEDKIKNIFALFSYILYIDGCIRYTDLNALLRSLFTDTNIKLEYSEEARRNVNELIRSFNEKKLEFFKLFDIKEFILEEKRYPENVIAVNLEQDCNISKLYSDFAIEKAYNSEVVFEDRTYLTLLLLNYKLLSEVISINYKKNYILKFPATLLSKQKKILKFLKAVDDDYLRSKIHFKFYYKEFKDNKKEVKELINQGYSVCLELDDSYDINFDDLFLFSYILVSKKYDYYDIIINSKEDVKTNIVTV